MEEATVIRDDRKWDQRFVDRLSRGASERDEESSKLSMALSMLHGVFIAGIAALTGAGFYASMGILVLVVLAIRLLVQLRKLWRRRLDERAPASPFGR